MLTERKVELLKKENKSLREEISFYKKQLELFSQKNELDDELKKSIQNNLELYKELDGYKTKYKRLCFEIEKIKVNYKKETKELLKQMKDEFR